ncbi:hypothetical protein FA743_06205 [Paracoccus gahaiensis]|uniref:Uncharacterized protein n=1 Tax=Paracoccus gahaiensis TaxID=1706839 RepID=A0A4U0RCP0_9RHOB|nr:hypothetical protein [Paracoccus gahaiensis]TJZ93079.1 hypothetical protein FA743_06205 [Paracoccus gahaiensis]
MRSALVMVVLALAGCGEHRGWNPNYGFGEDPYGQYKTAREVTLMTGGTTRQGIPVALPALSPTPAQIAGRDPVLPPPTAGIRQVPVSGETQAPPRLPALRPAPALPVATAPSATTP